MKILLYAIRFVALILLVSGLNWILDPVDAAKQLGMPLLEGLGRSTQIGDFSAFFLAAGTMAAMGTYRGQTHWLYGSALLLGFAAIGRTLAAVVHGAPFAHWIAVELIGAVLLVAGARKLPEADAAN